MPGSPDSQCAGRAEAPSQAEELADFMEQVWAFLLFCFTFICFFTTKDFADLTLL